MIDILFVHPDTKLSSIYQRKLKDYFQVHTAVDGLSAVRKVKSVLPKVIISEYQLPLLSGKSLIQFVRGYGPTKSSLFIFLTQNEFDHEALNLGATDWIHLKTASPELVINKIYVQINRTRSQ